MSIEARLRTDFATARKARDRERAAVLGVLLAAIENGAAVDADAVATTTTEVPRRVLSEAEIVGIVRSEVRELEAAAAELEGHGRHDDARLLRSRASIAADYSNQV